MNIPKIISVQPLDDYQLMVDNLITNIASMMQNPY